MTVYKGPRKGELYAKLRPEVQRRLEKLGRERALLYKSLVLTGLRKGELASLTVGQLVLDTDPPCLVLNAADEKNRQGSTIPLRADLATDLREWLAEKAADIQEASQQAQTVRFDQGNQGRAGLPADAPLFVVPDKLVRILNRDLKSAGISKRDERGRTVDVHALRHTFGTLLSKGGVAPRTAQAAMRHSTINLTMNTYTDPKLLDVSGAMYALPSLRLTTGAQRERNVLKATGTDDSRASEFAPKFAPTGGKQGLSRSSADKSTTNGDDVRTADPFAVMSLPDKRKGPLSTRNNRPLEVGARGLEPPTPSLSSWCSNQLS